MVYSIVESVKIMIIFYSNKNNAGAIASSFNKLHLDQKGIHCLYITTICQIKRNWVSGK